MSKRHGALGVDAYREQGFVPAALRSYLARLGWSHGDQEIFTTEGLIAAFDIKDVNKAPSRFDFKKLESFNAHFLRAMSDEDLLQTYLRFLPYADGGAARLAAIAANDMEPMLLLALPSAKSRISTLVELDRFFDFLFAPTPLDFDEGAQKQLQPDCIPYLQAALEAYKTLDDWSHDSLESCTKAVVEARGIKFGKLGMPLRAALTGTTSAPGIYDILLIFGREESLSRLEDCINSL
jgi:glutamyl-tRNA synthetase